MDQNEAKDKIFGEVDKYLKEREQFIKESVIGSRIIEELEDFTLDVGLKKTYLCVKDNQENVFASSSCFMEFFSGRIIKAIFVSLPFLAALAVGSVVSGVVVSGLNFAPGALRLRMDAVNPAKGLRSSISALWQYNRSRFGKEDKGDKSVILL